MNHHLGGMSHGNRIIIISFPFSLKQIKSFIDIIFNILH